MCKFWIKKLFQNLTSAVGLTLAGRYFRGINLNALIDP